MDNKILLAIDKYSNFCKRDFDDRQKESAKIIRQAIEQLPDGDVHAALPKKVRPNAGEVYGRYESARGDKLEKPSKNIATSDKIV